jgi:hypothetical protein
MGEVWRAFDFKLRVEVAPKTVTNLRVVRDEESSTGWRLEIGWFPGWATVSEW